MRVRLAQDPESLNPISYNSNYSRQVLDLLFQSLLTLDLEDNKLKPFLTEAMPEIEVRDSVALVRYCIRDEARWSDHSAVTARDVAFTLKVLNSPLVNNERRRPYYEFIKDIHINAENSKQFTLVCADFSPELETQTGLFYILPEYLFDPAGLLKSFTVPELQQHFDSLSSHPDIEKFAEEFNSNRFTRDKDFLKGSAGYQLAEWVTGRYILLEKKAGWWAEPLDKKYITANSEKINFQIISDNATAIIALQNHQLDVFDKIPVREFSRLKEDQDFSENYNLFTPETFQFYYVGINSRLPQFSEVKTRKALAHLLDVKNIIKVAEENQAVRAIGPIRPSDSLNFNEEIVPYEFDLQKAGQLLIDAGWRLENEQWNKVLNGESITLEFTVSYKAGNQTYENIALIFQQAAKELHIPVDLHPIDGQLLSQNLKNHNFDMYIRALVGGPFSFNFKPILHTESSVFDGGNYTGFGTAESDSLIVAISQNEDPEKRAEQLKRFQEILHEQANILFLYFSQDRIAVHHRFSNLKISSVDPGYDVSAFTLKQEQ